MSAQPAGPDTLRAFISIHVAPALLDGLEKAQRGLRLAGVRWTRRDQIHLTLKFLGDVPASFVIVPPGLGAGAAFLVAQPPLPPSGAYHFGAVRVVGLARRGDEPGLDEVLGWFPDVRFIRLRPAPSGLVIARDLTDEIKHRLDDVPKEGQD